MHNDNSRNHYDNSSNDDDDDDVFTLKYNKFIVLQLSVNSVGTVEVNQSINQSVYSEMVAKWLNS